MMRPVVPRMTCWPGLFAEMGLYRSLLWPLWDTMNIATLGTLLGIVMAVPLAFQAA